MMSIEMHFYVNRNKDGTIHVQNAVMGMIGQHHIHSKKGFEKWKQGITEKCITSLEGECNCGLKIGDVKDHHGNITHNDRFE